IAVISKPRESGTITSRYFIPHQCHSTHAVTGSLALSAAIKINGTTATWYAVVPLIFMSADNASDPVTA
ncbi:hypothetical protein ACIKK6_32035, partial [Bacillus thuringiensis]